MINSTQGSPSC